jgi:HAD superfamily hydrolase (TIGR01509 family)
MARSFTYSFFHSFVRSGRLLLALVVSCSIAPCFSATVLVDAGKVFLDASKSGFAREIGFARIFLYTIMLNNPGNLNRKAFQALEYLFGSQEQAPGKPCACGNGYQLPQIMCDWLAGTYTGQEIIRAVNRRINAGECNHILSRSQKNCIKRTIKCIFDPVIHARQTHLIPEGVRLIQALKEAGNRVIVLSNYAADAWEQLSQKPEFQDLIAYLGEENLVISGQIGMIKPHRDIYEYVLKKYKLNPKNTPVFFIDDQQVNLDAAEKVGIVGLCLEEGNYSALYQQLTELDIDFVSRVSYSY